MLKVRPGTLEPAAPALDQSEVQSHEHLAWRAPGGHRLLHAYGGNFGRGSWATRRSVGVKDAERERAAATAMPEARRWHHRQVSADLAWEAAHLLGSDSEEAAEMLRRAGIWLIRQDDIAGVDRFYKELATRFSRTSIGRQARDLHWFPMKHGGR